MKDTSEFAQQLVVTIEDFTKFPEDDQRRIAVSVLTEIAERALKKKDPKACRYGKIFEQMTGVSIKDFRSTKEAKEMIHEYLND